jgi:hypothetical protein
LFLRHLRGAIFYENTPCETQSAFGMMAATEGTGPEATNNEETSMNANTITLPELNGTEKQVAWATDIRARLCRATSVESVIAHFQNEAAAGRVTETDIDRILAKHGELNDETIAKLIANFFAAETSASWWIENRNETSLTGNVFAAIMA